MTQYVHFVVYYSSDTKELVRDDDTAEANFDDGVVYDDLTEEWTELSLALDLESDRAMNAAIELYNSVIKKIGGSP